MNILCVNHTGAVSGAERSLLDLISGLRSDAQVGLACPRTGPLASYARSMGVAVHEISGIDGSLKLHPLETTRALRRLGIAAFQTAMHARCAHADVIHANSIRAGLLTAAAAKLSATPTVVHLRDRLPRTRVADASLRLIAREASVVVANSAYTAAGLRAVTTRGRLIIVHNAVDLTRFDSTLIDRVAMRARLDLPGDTCAFGVVGQITPWKGQLEAIQTIARLRRNGRNVRLVIVGEPKFISSATRYDNLAYKAELDRVIRDEGLADHVRFLGERSDIPEIMAALDVLLVPSWEEPFGRVVIEAMALGLAVVATSVGGPAEIIEDGVSGVLLPPRAPTHWADRLAAVVDAPELREKLGRAGMRRAREFALPAHVSAMRQVFAELIGLNIPER